MNLTDLKTIKDLLIRHGLFAKKSFGQNFLISSKTLEKIVETAKIESYDHVIEIGPGLGVLTQELAQKAKKVSSIELDENLFPLLEETLKDFSNIEIIHQNALEFEPPNTEYKLVTNIPYYITSPILNHFLQNKNKPKTLTLLVQKEVAEKICELDPDMSILSLQVALFGEAKLISKVPATAFYPTPKVDSAILHIETYPPDSPFKIPDEEALKILNLAKRAFTQGRKKLSNTLPELKEKLQKLELADKRPQHLSIKDWRIL